MLDESVTGVSQCVRISLYVEVSIWCKCKPGR